MNEKQSSEELIKAMILNLPPIEVWNSAMSFAINTVRDVLREESSELDYECATRLQQRLCSLLIQ